MEIKTTIILNIIINFAVISIITIVGWYLWTVKFGDDAFKTTQDVVNFIVVLQSITAPIMGLTSSAVSRYVNYVRNLSPTIKMYGNSSGQFNFGALEKDVNEKMKKLSSE